MAAPVGITESLMAKIAPYNTVACAITNERAVDMEAFHKNIMRKERWVDIRKFVSKGKRELSDGLFEIFGNYSDEPPHIIRDNLCGWIYDNFRQIETWFSIALKQKGISLTDWIENVRNPKQPGDELCLYLLCRMYCKHALVHLKHHWWCTIQHTLPGDLKEILEQCHLELVFVREWVFGEVKQIRKPLIPRVPKPKPLDTPDTPIIEGNQSQQEVTTTTTHSETWAVITVNATTNVTTKECNVHLVKLQTRTPVSATVTNTNMAYNMRTRPSKPETCHRTSDRLRRKIDYSKFMVGNEDDTSPPAKSALWYLKRKPTSSRIASQNYYTKPSSAPRPVRRPQSVTTTKPASSEEMRIAIDALLSLGNDVIPEIDITAENSALMPVSKNIPSRDNDNSTEYPENQNIKDDDQSTAENLQTPPTLPPAPAQFQPIDSTGEDTSMTNNNTADSMDSQHSKSNTTPKSKEKKGTLVTRSFALLRRTRLNRSFRCSIENCNQKFGAVKDLNQHHQDQHPPVKCDMCTESFSCPNEMLKHKYKHYEIMFECSICETS